jgi:enterochelin esterase family protein
MNSVGTGRYEDHGADELVAFLDDKFATVPRAEGRALTGSSSGGFGALRIGMRRPERFAHVWSHSGDALFEANHALDFFKVLKALEKRCGSLERLVKEFRASKSKREFDMETTITLGVASCYSPNIKRTAGFDLPFSHRTGELIPEIWRKWKAFDPVVEAPRHAAALKKLKTLIIDAGVRDEFNLHLGARVLSRELKRAGVSHRYEEHEYGHMDLSPRLDLSLSLLSRRIASR